MQTIQQQRARFALEKVEQAKRDLDADRQSRYRARASDLPAMIQMNGLGQTAAFYRMKGRDHAHSYLYDLLSEWLCRERGGPDGFTQDGPYHNHSGLLRGITHEDARVYRVAQAEALALMDWVKKFAKAYLAEDK